MARMFPQSIPGSLIIDKKKYSEVKVYEQLKRLSDEYVVFHSKITLKQEDGCAVVRKVYPVGEEWHTRKAGRQRRPFEAGRRELEEL